MTSMEKNTKVDKLFFGEILVKRNRITSDQLKEALKVQKKENSFLGEILVRLGYIEERDIVVALIMQYGFAYIAITKYNIDQNVLNLIPENFARENHVIALDRVGGVLSVVMADPLDTEVKEKLESLTQYKVAPFIATKSEIQEAIEKWYGKK